MNMDIEHVSCFSAGDSDAACGHLAQPVGNCVFCQWLQAHFGKRMFFVCIRKMEIPAISASEPYINNFHILFRDLKFFLQSDNFLERREYWKIFPMLETMSTIGGIS